MPRCETTTRDQYGTGSSFIDFDREQGSNVFAQRPLTKGAVLSAIGDTDVPGDVRNPAADLCTTSPPWEEIMKKRLVVSLAGLAISVALPVRGGKPLSSTRCSLSPELRSQSLSGAPGP